MTRQIHNTLRRSALALALIGIGGCSPVLDTRGYLPDEDSMQHLKVGEMAKPDVAGLLGTPSTMDPFSDDTWIYVTRKTRKYAFFSPTVLEQNVLVVHFAESGTVSEVNRYTLADGKVIDPVTRKTPSPGREMTFVEQLIGNVGKFSGTPAKR
jgi:outer membrane protein assembly factor BamE (lipoprotein component of BamABCDE complex)